MVSISKIKLEDICDIISGFAFSSKEFNSDSNSGTPIIRIQNIGDEECNFVYWKLDYQSKYLVYPGDILLSMSGNIKVDIWKGPIALLNQRIVKLVPKQVNPEWLFWAVQKKLDDITGLGKKSIINNVSINDLKNLEFNLPTIEKQNQIAEILSRSKKLIDNRKEQIVALSTLRQSVFLEMFGDPLINPKKWNVSPLGDFLDRIDSGWSPKSESFSSKEGEKGVLKLSAVTKGVYRYIENKALFVDTPFKPEIEVQNGDLLLTRKNTKELVGACAYVFETPPNLMMPDTIFRLIFKSTQNNIHPIFLWRLFNNTSFRLKLASLAEGSAGSMPNISKKNLMKINIIVPSLELQNHFSKVISKIEVHKNLLNKGLLILEDNFHSIMQRAYTEDLFND